AAATLGKLACCSDPKGLAKILKMVDCFVEFVSLEKSRLQCVEDLLDFCDASTILVGIDKDLEAVLKHLSLTEDEVSDVRVIKSEYALDLVSTLNAGGDRWFRTKMFKRNELSQPIWALGSVSQGLCDRALPE